MSATSAPLARLARVMCDRGHTETDSALLLRLHGMAARLSEQAAAIATTEHEVESEERELEIRTRELAVRKRELLQNSTQFEADFAVFLYAIEGAEAAAVAEGQGETEPVLRLVRDEREG